MRTLVAYTMSLALGLGVWAVSVPVAQAGPGDIVFEREKAVGVDPAVFPHWIHRIRYTCSVCHPALFQMKRGEDPVTMKSIAAGEHCGKCHNGRVAFPISLTTCVRCHYIPAD